MRIGQQALGHRHRQIGDAGFLDQRADVGIDLRIGRALAHQNQRALGAFEQINGALHRVRRGNLAWRRIDYLDQGFFAGLGIHALGKQFGRQVEVDAARPAGYGGADRARDTDTDVLGVEHTKGRLAQRLGDGELVHFLVIALLQVDDLAFAGAGDQDHREAVGGGICQRGQAIEKARRRDGEADTGLAGDESGDGCRVAGVLFMTERNDAYAFRLRLAREVGDRNAGQAINGVEPVEFQGIDDQVKTIGRCCGLCIGCHAGMPRVLGVN